MTSKVNSIIEINYKKDNPKTKKKKSFVTINLTSVGRLIYLIIILNNQTNWYCDESSTKKFSIDFFLLSY